MHPHPNRFDGLPETWSAAVKETHASIEEALGAISPEQATTLYEACSMFAMAEALDAQVADDGIMVVNARGAQALHPGIPEARAQRRTALAALKALGVRATAPTGASAAAAALAGARWGRP